MFSKGLFFIWFFLLVGNMPSSSKKYLKEYHSDGMLKAQGWINKKGQKVNYWTFYHPNGEKAEHGNYRSGKREKYWYFYRPNGTIEMEGHYANGKKAKWWLFYDENGKINHKCQLSGGIKNGYCLKYKDEKLKSAQKYTNGKKIKEWYSLRSFKRENKLSDLR